MLICKNRFVAAATTLILVLRVHGDAQIIYVDNTARGDNDGSTWNDAFTDLQDALGEAARQPGESIQIWVAQGSFAPGPPGAPLESTTFALVSGISLYGGFLGNERSTRDRDWIRYETILTGDLAGDGSQRVGHVLSATGATDVLIDGFTIRDGKATGGLGGGGLKVENATVTLANSIVLDNSGTLGGGIHADESIMTISVCLFASNESFFDGGAIYAMKSDLEILNSEFIDNYAPEHGGAIKLEDPTSMLLAKGCSFVGNLAADGGAMMLGATATLEDCVFMQNKATFGGAALWALDLHMKGCLLQSNSADGPALTGFGNWVIQNSEFINNNGGLDLIWSDGHIMITNTQFIGNHTDIGDGAGAYIAGSGTVEISDSVFQSNSAFVDGGGLFLNISGTALISNCHFADNSVDLGDGGGVMAFGTGEVRVVDSSIEGNFAGIGGYGAAAGTRNGSLIIERSTVNDNWGGLYAGKGGSLSVIDSVITDNFIEGVLVRPGSGSAGEATIINSIISNNIGDGVHIGPGPSSFATIINSTIVNNTGTYSGSMGGVFVKAGHADVRNSIIWGNGPDGSDAMESHQINVLDGTVDVSHSLIHMLTPGGMFDIPGANNSGDDPLFVNPNPTPGSGDEADFRLQPGSPAIDAGDNAFVPDPDVFPGADTDLDGNPRIIDGTGDGVAIVDLGAYEFQPGVPSIPGDLNGDGTVGVADLLILLTSWGHCPDCTPGDSAACPADLTGDCTVGVPDLLILLANWG